MVDTMAMVGTGFPPRQLGLVTVRQRSQMRLGGGQLDNSCTLVLQLAQSCECCKKIWSNSVGING